MTDPYTCDITQYFNTEIFNCYLHTTFTVPPDILDYPTSSDMVVHEGSNVTLQCAATGYPNPTITWRREDNTNIVISNSLSGKNTNCNVFYRKHENSRAFGIFSFRFRINHIKDIIL